MNDCEMSRAVVNGDVGCEVYGDCQEDSTLGTVISTRVAGKHKAALQLTSSDHGCCYRNAA